MMKTDAIMLPLYGKKVISGQVASNSLSKLCAQKYPNYLAKVMNLC
jgi:hypothetical protein